MTYVLACVVQFITIAILAYCVDKLSNHDEEIMKLKNNNQSNKIYFK